MANAAQAEKSEYREAAEKLVAKMPKKVRDATTIEDGGGKYTLLKYGNRTVASIRNKNVRITFGHDGTAGELAALAPHVAEAATSRPPLKTKEERQAEKQARKEAKEEAEAQAEE